MSQLTVEPNFSDADAFYEQLTELHRSRSGEDSERVNARLILLLANHIGDQNILSQAIKIAGEPVQADD